MDRHEEVTNSDAALCEDVYDGEGDLDDHVQFYCATDAAKRP